MPKNCLTKEMGEMSFLPTTVSQESLLIHEKQQRKSGDNKTALTDKPGRPQSLRKTASPKEAPRPLSA